MFYDELYQKNVAENEINLQYWETQLKNLQSLDFNIYADKLKVPILVPIGSKIFFRGELKHTNQVTVALPEGYFVKCSAAQAEVLRQHRIKTAQSKVDIYRREKEYIEKRTSFAKENVFEKEGQEILEEYSEEEDKVWRAKHRENVKKYKQSEAKENNKSKSEQADIADLWERLEELELQEELENELLDNYNEIVDKRKVKAFLQKEETLLRSSFKEECNVAKDDHKENNEMEYVADKIKEPEISKNKKTMATEIVPNENSKYELLQKVMNKQFELENKLHELNNREREQSKTEQDILERLAELEQLDELENELDRLDDFLDPNDVETEDSTEDEGNSDSTKLKKSISFADENEGRTLEITFSHTDNEPNRDVFDPKKGITKPSDLYEAYAQLFDNKTTSILKKSKYKLEENADFVKQTKQVGFKENTQTAESPKSEKTIVIKDVIENVGVNQHNIEGGARPTSLFKKKRMQNK